MRRVAAHEPAIGFELRVENAVAHALELGVAGDERAIRQRVVNAVRIDVQKGVRAQHVPPE